MNGCGVEDLLCGVWNDWMWRCEVTWCEGEKCFLWDVKWLDVGGCGGVKWLDVEVRNVLCGKWNDWMWRWKCLDVEVKTVGCEGGADVIRDLKWLDVELQLFYVEDKNDSLWTWKQLSCGKWKWVIDGNESEYWLMLMKVKSILQEGLRMPTWGGIQFDSKRRGFNILSILICFSLFLFFSFLTFFVICFIFYSRVWPFISTIIIS